MINSKLIDDLEPKFKIIVQSLLQDVKNSGINIKITSTYRDNEYQNYLYSIGRTSQGNIVTSAIGGQSYHNYRLAIDFVVIKNNEVSNNIPDYLKVISIAEKYGLKSGKNYKDYGHLYLQTQEVDNKINAIKKKNNLMSIPILALLAFLIYKFL